MQLFPKSLNLLPQFALAVLLPVGAAVVFVFWFYFSPKNLQVGYAPKQPVPYSHRLHVGELGMDCRYCHANVERSQEAMVPPTQVCMGCHSIVRKDSARLSPVRESWERDLPVEWVRVHKLPDHAFFNHSVHLSAGVGCVSCHGRIDQQDVVAVAQPLSMGWCLDCHRNPTPHLRPVSAITTMDWAPSPNQPAPQPARAVAPPQTCTGCHR